MSVAPVHCCTLIHQSVSKVDKFYVVMLFLSKTIKINITYIWREKVFHLVINENMMIDRSTFQCYIKALKIYLNMYTHFVLCYNVAEEISFINKIRNFYYYLLKCIYEYRYINFVFVVFKLLMQY